MGIAGVGRAVASGVEQPDPGCQLGRDVDDVIAGFEESLRERAPSTVGALDGPDPIRPDLA